MGIFGKVWALPDTFGISKFSIDRLLVFWINQASVNTYLTLLEQSPESLPGNAILLSHLLFCFDNTVMIFHSVEN